MRHTDNLFVLNLYLNNLDNRITFVLKEEEIKETTYVLDHPSKRYLTFQYQGESCRYSADELQSGTTDDPSLRSHNPKIIAGSFEFMAYSTGCDKLIRVNNGLFDATFTPR
ncbi:MAG: hypothetical protein U5K54_14190 [Cytophagales bacterium]|nr:hypothetical protein [Cytophagales bacterium]